MKEVTSVKGLIGQAQSVYFSQHKKLKVLEKEMDGVKAEMETLGKFLEGLGINLDEVVKKKQEASQRMSKARKSRKPKEK